MRLHNTLHDTLTHSTYMCQRASKPVVSPRPCRGVLGLPALQHGGELEADRRPEAVEAGAPEQGQPGVDPEVDGLPALMYYTVLYYIVYILYYDML